MREYSEEPATLFRIVTQGSQQRFFMYDSLSRLIRAKNPEQNVNNGLILTDSVTGNSQWSMSYAYDNNGNVTTKIDARNIAFEGRMAYTSNIVYTVAYNKKLVGEPDAPKNWIDILDERYRGKATSSTFLLPRLIGGLGLVWGEDKAVQFAREIVAKANLLLTRAPRESLLQSGERVYAFGEVDSLIRAVAAEGLPVSQVVPEPVVVGQFGVTVMKNAPHPNAARLLAGFLASAEGKAARLKATSQADYGPTSDNTLAKKLHSGTLQVAWDRPDNMAQREALFGRAAAILTGQVR